MRSNAIDFCYRMYSFHFEIKKLCFTAKAFKGMSFPTETRSIHSLGGAVQHGRRSQKMTCFSGFNFIWVLYYDALSSLYTY